MRLRNIPGSREAIAESPYVISEETMYACRGSWQDQFPGQGPLYLEIGMGKGRFLTDLAELHPENNYLGIEKYSSVLLRAVQKREKREDLQNLLFLRMDAEELEKVFAPGEVAGIYLNFSDPWPKDRHAHRRLPSRQFLARYEHVLAPGAVVEFKTDNQDLFDFALEEADAAGWRILACTRDLHADPVLSDGNIMTEYEERFSSMGNPICKLILTAGLSDPAIGKDGRQTDQVIR